MISKEQIEQIRESRSSKSNFALVSYNVTLANREQFMMLAEAISVTRSGALEGILYDPDNFDEDDAMIEETIWAFAPGQWTYVDRA